MKKTISTLSILCIALLLLLSTTHAADSGSTTNTRILGYQNKTLKDATQHIYFNGTTPIFPAGFFTELNAKIKALGTYRNLHIEVIGHSDGDRLSPESKAKWGSNTNLSRLRAFEAANEIRKTLNLPGVRYTSKGVGNREPLVANNSAANKAKNRRAEVNMYYEKAIVETTAEAAKPDPESTQQARQALAKTETDEKDRTLEKALTAVDENYTLLKRGRVDLLYGYSFSYSSSDSLILDTDTTTGAVVVIGVTQDARATHDNTFSLSYGLRNNLTLGTAIPVVATSSLDDDLSEQGIGDISLNVRWQPWPTKPGKSNMTLSSSLSLPTGESPYEIDVNNSLSTGSGGYALSFATNVNKLIDPIVAYGSISYTLPFEIDDLHQNRGARILNKVSPRPRLGYSFGMGYALTYGVSLNMGFQHSFGSKTKLEFSDETLESFGGHSALFNLSAGFRTSPSTVLSVNVGIGLTRESPDFVVGFFIPFSVKGLKSYFDKD